MDSGTLLRDLKKFFKDKKVFDENAPCAKRNKLPKTDPAVKGGKDRGNSNMSNCDNTFNSTNS